MRPTVLAFVSLQQKDLHQSVGLSGAGSPVFTIKYTNGRMEAGQGVKTSITEQHGREQDPR